jgi:hypothetical protein
MSANYLPPMENQGNALDPSLGLVGQWIIDETLFLFEPPPHKEFLVLRTAEGVIYGLSAEELSFRFGIRPGALLVYNLRRQLTVRVGCVKPDRGAERAWTFRFGLPGFSEVKLTLNAAKPHRRA